jgi:hypothetical protein
MCGASGAPEVRAVGSKLSQVSRERAFVLGVFLPVEGLPSKHAVPIKQLLMTFHQPAMRVGSFELAPPFVHRNDCTSVSAAMGVFNRTRFRSKHYHGGARRTNGEGTE